MPNTSSGNCGKSRERETSNNTKREEEVLGAKGPRGIIGRNLHSKLFGHRRERFKELR